MISINTVTYSKDIYLLLLQAHSIELFVEEPVTHYVYIQDNLIPIPVWQLLLESIYQKHKLVLLHNIYKQSNASGWVNQQSLKLMLASDMDEEYILSLDSKNIFFRPLSLNNFIGHDGGAGDAVDISVSDLDWVLYWKPWLKFIENKTGIKSPNQRFPATPFVFNKKSLSRMNDKINIFQLFEEAITKQITVSEYMLYSFFSSDLQDDRIWSRPSEILLNGEHDDIGLIYTICRRDLDNSAEYKENVRKFLTQRGLDPKYVNFAVDLTTQKDR